jgi:hypothetical protein
LRYANATGPRWHSVRNDVHWVARGIIAAKCWCCKIVKVAQQERTQ